MSKRCRGSSRSGSTVAALPSPSAVTIEGSLLLGDLSITITVAASQPDTDGVWRLFYDNGGGAVAIDEDPVGGSFFTPNVAFIVAAAADGEYFVVQIGGGTQFSGSSGPSNVVTVP